VDEVKDKSGQQMDVLSWKQEGVKNLPLQENGYFSFFVPSKHSCTFVSVCAVNEFLWKKNCMQLPT
jgi:hypothetical protein